MIFSSKHRNKAFLFVLVAIFFAGLYAQAPINAAASQAPSQAAVATPVLPDAPSPEILLKLEEAPTKFIGMTIRELLLAFGVPSSVVAVRGSEAWQDDIVFKYPGGLSFYIYVNRVWQVSVGGEYTKSFMGFALGSPLEVAVSMFGLPKAQDTQYSEWILPFENWPLRLRAILDANGKVTALFLYRSDI